MFSVRIQREDFDCAHESARLERTKGLGALVTFTGYCRDEGGSIGALELEHYPGMAEGEIESVLAEAKERWPLLAALVIHRFGEIFAGERIVFVATAASHRGDAFGAAEFLMDYLKMRAPFWKRERRTDGSEIGWVEAKESDDHAAKRWRPT